MLLARFLMFEKGLSWEQVSMRSGVQIEVLEQIVLGIIEPDDAQSKAIADALGYELDVRNLFAPAKVKNAGI